MLYNVFAYGEWGKIDEKGKVVLPIEYTSISSSIIIDNLTCHRVNKRFKKLGLIKDDGSILIEAVYDLLAYNEEQELFIVSKEGKFGVINVYGVVFIPIQCSQIQFTSKKGEIIIAIKNNWYLIDLSSGTEDELKLSIYKCILTKPIV